MSQNIKNKIIPRTDFNMWRTILNDSKLIKSPKYISESFNIPYVKVTAVLDEFEASGCVIIQSKLNGRYNIN